MLTHSCQLRRTVLLLASLALGSAQAGGHRSPAPHAAGALAPEKLQAMSARLPLSFEANQGQTDEQVRFLSRGEGYTLFLNNTEAVLALRRPQPVRKEPEAQRRADTAGRRSPETPSQSPPTLVRMQLVGANPRPKVAGAKRLPGEVNYFLGREPQKWHTRVPTFREVRYDEVYPGVDLVYYGNQRQLEYDFVVAPGADPRRIRLAFAGAKQVEVAPNGDLVLHTPGGDIRQQKPLLYQKVAGVRRAVSGGYTLLPTSEPQATGNAPSPEAGCQVGFQVAHYDVTQPLVIDPVLSYATFLGGGLQEEGHGVAVDAAGNVYVAGLTASANYPVTPNSFDRSVNRFEDVFVTKLNATGSALVYSTYIGGDGFDRGEAIALDAAGNVYVTGNTGSRDFPTTGGAPDRSHNGVDDAFVTKLNATGTALLYSTYLGGSSIDGGEGIAIDTAGNAYVTGFTFSTNFPALPGSFDPHFDGFVEGFVTKLNAEGSALLYSTFLGGVDTRMGELTEACEAIAVDTSGNAYVTGHTESADFPTTPGAFDRNLDGFKEDIFVTKLNAAGSALLYSTYLGGIGRDLGYGIAVDGTGNAYITGQTDFIDFPTTPDAFDRSHNGQEDAFVTKLDTAGSSLVYSTYLGGGGQEIGFGITVDHASNAYLTGVTDSTDFPTTPSAPDRSFNGGFTDAFVTTLNAAGSALLQSTYLGGTSFEEGLAIAVDSTGNDYVTGRVASADFPTTPGAFDTSYNGEVDAFLVKLVKLVASLSEQIEAILRQVEQLVATGVLQPSDSTALVATLQETIRQLEQGHSTRAYELLQSFVLQVNALVKNGKLPVAQGTALTSAAQAIITPLTPATFTVTNTQDMGPGSLRAALEAANATASSDTILFRIPATDPGFAGGVFTIRLQSQLPAAQGPTTLDGFSQTAFSGNTNPNGPEVVLNGASAGSSNGLQLDGVGSVARGFVIQGFVRSGIVLTGAQNRVEGCYVGTNAAGTVAVPNGESGIAGGGNNHRIGGTEARFRNVISGNGEDGIHLEGVSNTVVLGNFIGTNALGTVALPNLQSGVSLLDAHDNRVGGSEPGSRNLISGNGGFGVVLEDGNHIQVQGNYIGTEVRGERALPNGRHGVSVSEMGSVLIGGTSDATRNVISGNGGDGVQLTRGTSASQVQGNYIGLNAAGTAALANQGSGIELEDGSNNLLGGTTVGQRNIISGNAGDGISVLFDAVADLIQGNYIGTNPVGRVRIPNGGNGVRIADGAQAIQVGGTSAGARNLISGNAQDGVQISGAVQTTPGQPPTALNQVQGNFIGTDVSGDGALPNGANGVHLREDTPRNVIGGTSSGARNLISGNTGNGVLLEGSGTQENQVAGNFIGTRIGGTVALPNGGAGVLVSNGAPNNRIGGTTAGARNLISGNQDAGVAFEFAGPGNRVEGNFIGTNVGGGGAVPNRLGVLLEEVARFIMPPTVIGGSVPGARNVISGNRGDGILGEDTFAVRVQGNYIGTNVTGTAAVPNQGDGVSFSESGDVEIGGSTPAAGNVISGNRRQGISLDFMGSVPVRGNYIGVNAAGSGALPNGENGIRLMFTGSSTIGGTDPGSRNVISGNRLSGIFLSDNAIDTNVVGNYIGTNAAGTVAVPNGEHGIMLYGGRRNHIGGAAAGAGNVISGNTLDGVFLFGLLGPVTTNNQFQGNFIGTNALGTGPLPNRGHGVELLHEIVTGNQIGGAEPGAGNHIAFNLGDGVLLQPDSPGVNNVVSNPIRANSIHDNRGLGINLRPFGEPPSTVTPNDFQDPDPGPNRLQNFPVLTSAVVQPGQTTLAGTLNSTPNSPFALDFFRSPAPDPSGYGEGQQYLGSATVATDASGNASFTFAATGMGAGEPGFFTATATNTVTQDTGEFSAALQGSGMTLAAGSFPEASRNRAVQPVQIIGQVTDAGGAGMAGVRLSLHQPLDRQEIYSSDWDPGRLQVVYTEATGAFRFSGLAPGRYLVLAYAPGVYFTPRAQWVEVGLHSAGSVSFTVAGADLVPPVVALDSPGPHGPAGAHLFASGAAWDHGGAGPRAVMVRLYRLQPEPRQPELRLDWQTGAWDAEPSARQSQWLDVGGTDGRWRLALPPLAPGTYRLEVQATDWAGNRCPAVTLPLVGAQ